MAIRPDSVISKEAARHFECGRTFSKSNTRVLVEGGYWVLELHGSNIARYPVDGSWNADGEITTAGYAGMVTNSRLNALSGVAMWGHVNVFLHGWPWDESWTSKHGPEPEKCSRQLAKERGDVMEQIGLMPTPFGSPREYHRKRRGEAIMAYDVFLPRPSQAEATILCRPWATKPWGEIIVERASHIQKFRFECWRHFDRALGEAVAFSSPDLVKLGHAAKDILASVAK